MRRRKLFQNQGFTLIEVIVAVVIIGILSAVAVIKVTNTDTAEISAATRKVVSDIQYAQDLAMTTGNHVEMKFDVANNSYQLFWSDGTPIPNIMGSGNFVVQYGTGSFPHVTITATNLNEGILMFDAIGQPYSNTALIASNQMAVEINAQKQVFITPYSGKVYVETVQ